MYDDVINLIAIDERGNDVGKHEVFCRRESITRAEHYQAAAVGLHPSVQFRLADWRDYDGQRFIVERTYETRDGGLEIVVR